jgi:hypothetical protein
MFFQNELIHVFSKNQQKYHPTNRQQINRDKSCHLAPTWFQNGANIDANTDQKSMLKLVSNKIKNNRKKQCFYKL